MLAEQKYDHPATCHIYRCAFSVIMSLAFELQPRKAKSIRIDPTAHSQAPTYSKCIECEIELCFVVYEHAQF